MQAIDQASVEGARVICFPECFVPGLRGVGKPVAPPDPVFLERVWSVIAEAAAKADITVVLGTERFVDGALVATALVIDRDGSIAGFQDKVQIDPSEEGIYTPGSGRRVFQAGPLTFGIAICHEGWRYPETVRWAARHGAHIVFHPSFSAAEPGSFRPRRSPIPRIHFTRRPHYAAPRRIPAISQLSITQAPARRLRPRSSARWNTAQLPALR